MMKPGYDRWRKRLAGEKVVLHELPEPEDCGFYRLPIREQLPLKNGQGSRWKIIGWERAALIVHEEQLAAVIGDRVVSGNALEEKWLWFAAHPISEEWYRAAERGEPWPDSHETVSSLPVANSSAAVDRTDALIASQKQSLPVIAAEVMADVIIGGQIDEAANQLAKYAIIDSDEHSSKARSLQQKFLDLRGEAATHYDELNRPLLDEQKRIRSIWFPIRDRADEAASKLRKAMGVWEDVKRKAAQVAAERAEAGQEVRSNVPPPSSQIRGSTGKAASVSVAVFVTAIDEDAVYKQFKGNPAITELLTALAQKAIRAGIQVPGATTEERSVVR